MSRRATINPAEVMAEIAVALGDTRHSAGIRLAEQLGAAYDREHAQVVLTREQTEREMGTPEQSPRPFVSEAIRP